MHPTSHRYIDVQPTVRQALDEGGAVVALESTIISHGMPYPQNVETAKRVEATIRSAGAVPATIAVRNGRLLVGLDDEQLLFFGRSRNIGKASRRDIPLLVATGGDAATTVAATMLIAGLAGIDLFVTGGIGGVHRGAERSLDISADLQELAHTNVAVVCAGAKSILDIGGTIEYLETHGVPIIGYRCDRLPAFYTPSSDFGVDMRLDNARSIARVVHDKWALGIRGGIVIANPIPTASALDREEIDKIIDNAIAEANAKEIQGRQITPYLLSRIEQLTGGRSLQANIDLVLNNARLGAAIAQEMSHLKKSTNDNEHQTGRSDYAATDPCR